MDNLLRDYGVKTEAQLVRAIQDEYERETDERPAKAVAEVILDRMLEAEYQRIAGGAYDERRADAWADRMDEAQDTLPRDPIEVYGTPEHEAWLIEMERQEG